MTMYNREVSDKEEESDGITYENIINRFKPMICTIGITPSGTITSFEDAKSSQASVKYNSTSMMRHYKRYFANLSGFVKLYTECLRYPWITYEDTVILKDLAMMCLVGIKKYEQKTNWCRGADDIFYVMQDDIGELALVIEKYHDELRDHHAKMIAAGKERYARRLEEAEEPYNG